MRTSNKIILSAFVLFAIGLMAYNSTLKAEYLTGKYKDPYRNYTSYNINEFDEIEVNAAAMMHVTIRQGDFAVRKSKWSQDSVRFTKVGNHLLVNIDFDKDPFDSITHKSTRLGNNEIIISCPKLKVLKTDSYYTVKGVKPLKSNYSTQTDDYYPNSVILKSFKLDSLSIVQNDGIVDINSSAIGFLHATANVNSKLIIHEDNKIAKANLVMNHYSTLNMDKLDIPQLNFAVADSAKIYLTGAALKRLTVKK